MVENFEDEVAGEEQGPPSAWEETIKALNINTLGAAVAGRKEEQRAGIDDVFDREK